MRMQICKNERKVWIQRLNVFLLLILIFTQGCGYGVYHRVKKGETIDEIARKYNVRKEDIIEANRKSPHFKDQFKEGDYVYIPLDRQTSAQTNNNNEKNIQVKENSKTEEKATKTENKVFKVSIPSRDEEFQEKATKQAENIKPKEKKVFDTKGTENQKISEDFKKDGKFILDFPVEGGQIISNFGMRNGRAHKGVDIKAPEGTPIKAAQDGVVVFSGFIKGYGNTVIIKHEGDYFTVYAHNKYNTTKEGEFVKRGTVIGYVGMTGNAETSHLHFEVRKRTNPLNPLLFFKEEIGRGGKN